jgi:hypothetical protein
MNTKYKFYFSVLLPDYIKKSVAFELDAYEAREARWDPYDLCSDAMTAAIAGGITPLGARRIDTQREKLAAHIAPLLTDSIMKALKSRDLINGYEQERLPAPPQPAAG